MICISVATRKEKSKAKKKLRFLSLGLISIVIICTLSFTVGKYWVEIIEKYQEQERLTQELEDLKDKQKELELDAKKLQDSEYIARYAREKYYYSKDGEIIIKIPEE